MSKNHHTDAMQESQTATRSVWLSAPRKLIFMTVWCGAAVCNHNVSVAFGFSFHEEVKKVVQRTFAYINGLH
jgi:hypothetical protein